MVYVGFMMLKVKVPVSFSGTEGFPARRDARYSVHKPATLPPLPRTYHVGLSRFNVCLAYIRLRLLSQISPLALQSY
jgi:hypothetical protein